MRGMPVRSGVGSLARQDHPLKPHLLQKTDVGGFHVVHLGAGDQGQRREMELEQAGVLNDQRIDPGIPCVTGDFPGRLKLVVEENGVQRQLYPRAIAEGMTGEPLDIGHGVACSRTGAEGEPSDVDRIRPVVHGGLSAEKVPGRRKKLKCFHHRVCATRSRSMTITKAACRLRRFLKAGSLKAPPKGHLISRCTARSVPPDLPE